MRNRKSVRTITIASGKGGVGKTNVVANLAIALRKMGKEVLILDADLGLSNVDILLHLAPRYNIQHVIRGEKRSERRHRGGSARRQGAPGLVRRAGTDAPGRVPEDAAPRGVRGVRRGHRRPPHRHLRRISENVAFFCVASREIVIVTSPEPTALTDAYALIKVLFTRYQEKEFHVLVNSARNPEDAKDVYRKLATAADRFLSVSLDYLGYLPYDKSVHEAVRAQKPFLDMFPNGAASRALEELASRSPSPRGGREGRASVLHREPVRDDGEAR
jgi:flagellar biosynthesis protein FlhG